MTTTGMDKRTLVVGLGLTGLSCARWLAARGEPFAVCDSRAEPPGLDALRREFPDVTVETGPFREATFLAAGQLLLSPGVDPREPVIRRAVAAGVPVSGDVDVFSREVRAPIVAVTGSNAKSTVVSLVGEMAKAAGIDAVVAGNIGTPVLDLLREPARALDVLELSCFQLETTRQLGAEVATVLNLSVDHMDRYDSMQAYHQAKHRIFRGCRQAVVNRDDPLSAPLLPAGVRRWSFGLSRPEPAHFGLLLREGREYLAFGAEALLPVEELRIAGRHNVANALAALALGRAAGLDFAPMLEALRRFPGLPHRCEWVGELDGVPWFNDSKGTNVGATLAAIEGLAGRGRIILLAGGVGKGADFAPLAAALGRHGKAAVLYGEDAGRIDAALGNSVPRVHAASFDEALDKARAAAAPGDVVLLSPACASFDMFRSYVHRGEVFTAWVREAQRA